MNFGIRKIQHLFLKWPQPSFLKAPEHWLPHLWRRVNSFLLRVQEIIFLGSWHRVWHWGDASSCCPLGLYPRLTVYSVFNQVAPKCPFYSVVSWLMKVSVEAQLGANKLTKTSPKSCEAELSGTFAWQNHLGTQLSPAQLKGEPYWLSKMTKCSQYT